MWRPNPLRTRRCGGLTHRSINYERIGILHMEEGWDVRYCAARCPRCRKLMDLFANLTESLSLSEMWPHLLAKDLAHPERGLLPWQPTDLISRVTSLSFGVWFFLIVLWVVSLLPEISFYSHQPVFDSTRFIRETLPPLLLRGVIVGSMGYLLLLRRKMIALFSDIDGLGELLKINRDGLVYWSNFAVNRFTGYQKKGKKLPTNAVTLLGGFLSVLILVASWLTVRVFASGSGPLPSLLVMVTELGFWMCIAAGFGVIAWNLSVIPVYVLEGAKNIPIKDNRWDNETPTILERVRTCADRGLYVLLITAIVLSMFPLFTPPFAEVTWAIIWAQLALIICLVLIIVRVKIVTAQDKVVRSVGVLEVASIVAVYIAIRTVIGISQDNSPLLHFVGWLGITGSGNVKTYMELMVFSCLSAYLFFSLAYGKKKMVREIRIKAIRESYQPRLEEANRANDPNKEKQLLDLMERKIARPRQSEKRHAQRFWLC